LEVLFPFIIFYLEKQNISDELKSTIYLFMTVQLSLTVQKFSLEQE